MTSPGVPLSRLIASRIRAERESAGLGVAQLSARSGVARGTVADLERGRRAPTLETLAKLAAGLDLPVAALLEERAAGPEDPWTPHPHLVVTPLGGWVEGSVRVEVSRLRISGPVRHGPAVAGARAYVTVVAGTLAAGSASTPRTVRSGQQVAFAVDQPHVLVPTAPPVEAVLVLRSPSGDALPD